LGLAICENSPWNQFFGCHSIIAFLYEIISAVGSVADADPFDTDLDPDPAFHFDTDPDPAFQSDTDPDPAV
jgi:hypothetical protein